jgi:hypothetical protein
MLSAGIQPHTILVKGHDQHEELPVGEPQKGGAILYSIRSIRAMVVSGRPAAFGTINRCLSIVLICARWTMELCFNPCSMPTATQCRGLRGMPKILIDLFQKHV